MQARLDLQGGDLRAGTIWSARIDSWSEKTGESIAQRDKDSAVQGRRILALEERTAKIERPRGEEPKAPVYRRHSPVHLRAAVYPRYPIPSSSD